MSLKRFIILKQRICFNVAFIFNNNTERVGDLPGMVCVCLCRRSSRSVASVAAVRHIPDWWVTTIPLLLKSIFVPRKTSPLSSALLVPLAAARVRCWRITTSLRIPSNIGGLCCREILCVTVWLENSMLPYGSHIIYLPITSCAVPT